MNDRPAWRPSVVQQRWVCTVLGGVVITGALLCCLAGCPGTIGQVLAASGLAFLALGVLAGLTGLRISLAACSALLTLLVLLACYRETLVFYAEYTLNRRTTLGIHARHPRYCYRHRPVSSARHRLPEFDVRYTIDDHGARVTPTPVSPAGQVLVLGCSFSFGHGVGDQQHYPYLLGKDHWPEHKVRNLAVMGWGTAHALLALQEQLDRGEQPKLVLYSWIRQHLYREYDNDTCLKISPALFDPHLESARTQHEINLIKGVLLMREMFSSCERKKIPFWVLVLSSLPNPGEPKEMDVASAMMVLLKRFKVPHIDLRGVAPKAFYRFDQHPTSSWHSQVARAVGGHPGLSFLRSGR